ncbi:hypothetical protein QFZ23_004359 [Arthrobacter globiformis]|uniref:hypothetical protein n=1 Tax=Arthrobacter globiformis TaxID=1665 RepID=UPI00278A6048|nr:hypothetical protein [Arthrobacter globiformis]MDQ1060458.1 hypothetical protein [Arthrobacter globiformis]
MMRFERSAGIFKAGVLMAIGGPVLAALGAVIAAPNIAVLYTGNANRERLVIGLIIAAVGLLLTAAGYIMILVAVHRALVKIDALPVRQQPRAGQGSPHSASDFTY